MERTYNAVEVTCRDGGVYCHRYPINVEVVTPPNDAVEVTIKDGLPFGDGTRTHVYDDVTRIEFLKLNRAELRKAELVTYPPPIVNPITGAAVPPPPGPEAP